MITSFEVASIFKVRDEATATLTRMAEKVTEFNLMVKEARENLAGMGRLRLSGLNTRLQGLTDQAGKLKGVFGGTFAAMDTQVASAIAEVHALAEEWRAVATAATAATRATRSVAVTNPRQRIVGPGGGGGIGGGVHVSSLGLPFPGGHASVRLGNNAAMVGAGALAYGAYEEAKFEDAAFRAMFTAGIPADQGERTRRMQELRDLIQRETIKTGAPIGDIESSVLTGLRQFAGMPWQKRMAIMPDLIEASAAESVLKGGTSVNEGMEVFTGLAHMTKEYDPEQIKALIPKFAYLSLVDPESITRIEKAASYAVPILQSGLDIDPFDTLLLTAALQRGGVANTKSGTWIREMAVRAMPGTSLMSKTAFKKHEGALQQMGLVDAQGNPAWFTDGKPDIIKLLDIAGEHAKAIPLTQRSAIERQLFGAQGSGAFAVLSDPAVLQQVHTLREEMEPFRTGVTFFKEYEKNSPVQQFRDAWADTQIVLMDIGTKVLPPVVSLLKGFDQGLKDMKDTLGSGVLGTIVTAGLGAYAGARIAGAPGAVAGGIIGAAIPNTPQVQGPPVSWSDWLDRIWQNPSYHLFGIGSPAISTPPERQSLSVEPYRPSPYATGSEADLAFRLLTKRLHPAGQTADDKRHFQVTTVINLDGQKLAQLITKRQVTDAAGAPQGAPYHDPTHSTLPPDFAMPF